jgi:ribosomal protein L32
MDEMPGLAYIENGLCPQCGDLTENDTVCTQCGYVSGSKTGEEDDPVVSNR